MFESVCVHNNTEDDADARLRAQFEEPAWNNPVVRFLDASREDLVERVTGAWTVGELADGMVSALRAAERDVPTWLALLADEEIARPRVESAIFSMG